MADSYMKAQERGNLGSDKETIAKNCIQLAAAEISDATGMVNPEDPLFREQQLEAEKTTLRKLPDLIRQRWSSSMSL